MLTVNDNYFKKILVSSFFSFLHFENEVFIEQYRYVFHELTLFQCYKLFFNLFISHQRRFLKRSFCENFQRNRKKEYVASAYKGFVSNILVLIKFLNFIKQAFLTILFLSNQRALFANFT